MCYFLHPKGDNDLKSALSYFGTRCGDFSLFETVKYMSEMEVEYKGWKRSSFSVKLEWFLIQHHFFDLKVYSVTSKLINK